MPNEKQYQFHIRQDPPSQELLYVMRARTAKALKRETNNRSFVLTCCPAGVVFILLGLFAVLDHLSLQNSPVELMSFGAMTLWIGISYSWFLKIESKKAKLEKKLALLEEAPMSTANCLMEMDADPVIREYTQKACKDRYLTVGEVEAINDAWLASGSRKAEEDNHKTIAEAMAKVAGTQETTEAHPAIQT